MRSEIVHRFARLALVTAASALAIVAASGVVARGAEATATDEGTADDAGAPGNAGVDAEAPDAGAEGPARTPPAPAIELSGGVVAALPSSSEATTQWRYGRDGAGKTLDEVSSRVHIVGSGRTAEGMAVDFSVALVVPALRVGTYGVAPPADVVASEVLASVWARRDRGATSPDIAWEIGSHAPGSSPGSSPGLEGARSALKLELVAVAEASHTSDRHGGVTVDVTHSRIHGTLEVTLPCVRSQPTARAACRPETLRGTF